MFPDSRKGIKMCVKLPVILSSSGIMRDFIKLSEKSLQPSPTGDYPDCKLVCSISLFYCSWEFFQLSLPLCYCLFFFLCELAISSTPFFSPSHSLGSLLAIKTKTSLTLKKAYGIQPLPATKTVMIQDVYVAYQQ